MTAHLRPGERIVWSAKPSKWGLFPIGISTLLAVIAFIVASMYGFQEPRVIPLPGPFAFLVAIAGFGADFLRRSVRILFTTYVVTDRRFYGVTSFLATTVNSIPLARITTVRLRQGIFARLFGLWTATVSAYGEAGTTLHIPAIRDQRRLLEETSEGIRRGANANWLLRGD